MYRKKMPAPPKGLTIPADMLSELKSLYSQPRRVYHVLGHAFDVAIRTKAAPFSCPNEAFVAALFHDAVYDVKSKRNEEWSAEIAEEACLKYNLPVDAALVGKLIRATALHGVPSDLGLDEALFCDCDAQILGAPYRDYSVYSVDVLSEYLNTYPEEQVIAGRIRFLESMLAAPSVFLTEWFRERYEDVARKNLEASLASLSSPLL